MTTLAHLEPLHPYAAEVLAGDSAAVRRLRLQVARIAPHFRMALLTGEAGVGKHAVARHMHSLSPGAREPFRVMEAAEFALNRLPGIYHGTVYLRSLDALQPGQQSTLLRALRSIDRETRIVVASEADLKGMVSAGRMRADLYEAIGTLAIRVPPLRERLDDLDLLAGAMIAQTSETASFSPSALERMHQYAWPGNLAELFKLSSAMAAKNRSIDAGDLPPMALDQPTFTRTPRLEEVMRRHVMDVLEGCSGNKLRAAELLGISRSTLYRMLETQPSQTA